MEISLVIVMHDVEGSLVLQRASMINGSIPCRANSLTRYCAL
jgi:hypothetical protein